MKTIPIPQTNPDDCWEGTTGIECPCGGTIEWAEGGYAPGYRACRSCLVLFKVRNYGVNRELVPQSPYKSGILGDASEDTPDEDLHHVSQNLYPGWHIPAPK